MDCDNKTKSIWNIKDPYFRWHCLSLPVSSVMLYTCPITGRYPLLIWECAKSSGGHFMHFIYDATNSVMKIMKQNWIFWTVTFTGCMMEKWTLHTFWLVLKFGCISVDKWNLTSQASHVKPQVPLHDITDMWCALTAIIVTGLMLFW